MTAPVLIAGEWRPSRSTATFRAFNPEDGSEIGDSFPVSGRDEAIEACQAAAEAAEALRHTPSEQIAEFLDRYAAAIDAHADDLCRTAALETALPFEPRLRAVELPRTTAQLRQAAAAAREESWRRPTIDTRLNIRSCHRPLGPVLVIGPNNFPLAFNAVSGGDFAAATAAGCPVIAKGHPAHPGATRRLAELAHRAASEAGLPAAAFQVLYHVDPEVGLEMVAHPAVKALAFTGSRAAGMRLKAEADRAGTLAYLEMSSVNPVFLLPGALGERADEIAAEFATSCLMGVGQFCTNPGLVAAIAGERTERFVAAAAERLAAAPPGVQFSRAVADHYEASLATLTQAGASVVARGPCRPAGFACRTALLRVAAKPFLGAPGRLLAEAFGPASLVVIAASDRELISVARRVGGSLTGCIYAARDGSDDALHRSVASALEPSVGRLLNDKMPTGVAVSPAMVHGGPYPATAHPGFTSVGLPASMTRFGALVCYDNVRADRLPPILRDDFAGPGTWRCIDGAWRQA